MVETPPIEKKSQWLTTSQVATLYDVNRDTVWDWIRRGLDKVQGRPRLKARRIGYCWKTTQAWLDEFFAACAGEGGTPAVAETPAAIEARVKREQAEAAKQLGGKRTRGVK